MIFQVSRKKNELEVKRNTLIKSCIYPSDVPPLLILTEKESGQNKSHAFLFMNPILHIYFLDGIIIICATTDFEHFLIT